MSDKEHGSEMNAYRNGYHDAEVDILEQLLRETRTTTTYEDILLAAFDNHQIADEVVHEARDRILEDEPA